MTYHCYAEWRLCLVPFMLSVTCKPLMLSVAMLNGILRNGVMLNAIILSVAKLNFIKLSVVAP